MGQWINCSQFGMVALLVDQNGLVDQNDLVDQEHIGRPKRYDRLITHVGRPISFDSPTLNKMIHQLDLVEHLTRKYVYSKD